MNNIIYPLTIYYDSACPLCNAEMTNLKLRNKNGLLRFKDISGPECTDLPNGTHRNEMLRIIHALKADGSVIKGVEVFRLAYSAVGLGWVMAPTQWPILGKLADFAYPWVARNRYRFPRFLVRAFFETRAWRAAKRAAVNRCSSTECDL